MDYQINRAFDNQVIVIPVRTYNATRLICTAFHPFKQNTVYFDAAPIINVFDKFVIKIPKMPPQVIVSIYNEANGNIEFDTTFQIGEITIEPIRLGWAINKIADRTVRSFAIFSDEFAENAGILSAQNSVYLSPCGRFRIDYKDVIRDDNGNELRTPARINSSSGLIEIAKKYYSNYTVPGRKAINWHEFSHVYRNVNRADELEADKNAIMIYLGMGNPTVEAYNVFLKVFKNTPSDLNKKRYQELDKFIKDFNSKIHQFLQAAA